MKLKSTLVKALVLVLMSSTVQAEKTNYRINSSRNWTNNNNQDIPTTCVNCTFTIASGATLTINSNVTLQNCTFNGGTVIITDQSMALQTNSGLSTYFNDTKFLVYGSSVITGSAPIYMSNSTFTFYGSSKFNPQHLLDLTNSKLNFYGNSVFITTGGPVNLKSNSMLTAGNGAGDSKAYLYFNGPTLNVYDNSSVVLGSNNNYYFNWSSYYAASRNIWYSTAVNKMNCGTGYPNTCQMPYVYGPSMLSGGGLSGMNILPVIISEFTATASTNYTVSLKWVSQTEVNASRFVVERSSDGTTWTAIGTVTATGNTSTVSKYAYTDNSAADGLNYYRLKVIDVDGFTEYSGSKSVIFAAAKTVKVFPNPATSFVNVSIPVSNSSSVIRLLNTTGQVLQERTATSGTVSMPVSNYTPGTYFIQIVSADGHRHNSSIIINK